VAVHYPALFVREQGTKVPFQALRRWHTATMASSPHPRMEREPRTTGSPFGKAVLVGLVLTGALLGLYEILERTMLQGLEMETLHTLHRVRGLLASILVALAAVSIGLRSRPSPFSVSAPESFMPRAGLHRLARWYHWMRWLACASAVVLIMVTVEVLHLLPADLLGWLLAMVGLLALVNLVFGVLLERDRLPLERLLLSQMYLDLVILTVLLHFSGGIENPMSFLYLFHVVIAGILFSRDKALAVAVVGAALFTGLALLECFEWIGHYTLQLFPHGEEEVLHASHHLPYVVARILLQVLLLLTSWYFITTVVTQLRREEVRTRAAAREALRAREELEGVVDAAGAGLCVLDRNLRVIWRNRRFHSWAGHEAMQRVMYAARKTLADGRMRMIEEVRKRPAGERFLATTVARTPSGQGVVLLLQDITGRRRAEWNAAHAERLAALGTLASNLAHELNNPLAIISARVRLMLGRWKDLSMEELQRGLREVAGLCDRMAELVQGLLHFSRRPDVPIVPVRLPDMLAAVRRLVESRYSQAGITLEATVPPDLPEVRGNPQETEQVLVNLLLNAASFSPEGGRVRVTAERDGGAVLLHVDDEGPGVPAGMEERVFEPFVTLKGEAGGTGLGLSIARNIVLRHGGSMSCSRGPLGGARFTVRLLAAEKAGS